MTALTGLSLGGAIAATDEFYGVETAGVGGVRKTGAQFQELSLDFVAGALLGSGLIANPVHNDGADTITFALDDIAEDQFLGRANGAGTGAPTVLSATQARAILGAIFEDLNTLGAPTADGQFIVATGAGAFAYEDGATVRTSLSLGSAALEDYEEGSFTPTFDFATTGDLSNSYAVQQGEYARVGDIVHYRLRMRTTPTHTTSSGNARVAGLPFSPDNSVSTISTQAAYVLSSHTWPSSTTMFGALMQGTQTYLEFQTVGSGVSSTVWGTTQVTSGSAFDVRVTGTYRTT